MTRVNPNENPSSPPLQALWLCGSQAGKHNGQRQPPLCRAGARAAGHCHRQLCLQDDRLAKTMRGLTTLTALARFPSPLLQLLWLLLGYFLFSAAARFLLVFLFLFCFLQNMRYQKRACALYSAKRGCSRVHVIIILFFVFPVDGIQNGSEEVQDEGVVVCVTDRRGGRAAPSPRQGSAYRKKKSSCCDVSKGLKVLSGFWTGQPKISLFCFVFLKRSGLSVRGLKYYFVSHLNMAA